MPTQPHDWLFYLGNPKPNIDELVTSIGDSFIFLMYPWICTMVNLIDFSTSTQHFRKFKLITMTATIIIRPLCLLLQCILYKTPQRNDNQPCTYIACHQACSLLSMDLEGLEDEMRS